jgi:hypothetical protein
MQQRNDQQSSHARTEQVGTNIRATEPPDDFISSKQTAEPSASIAGNTLTMIQIVELRSSTNSVANWTMIATAAGTAIPLASRQYGNHRCGLRTSANQTPGTPSPNITIEIVRNSKWYQTTTLRMRVKAICRVSTAKLTAQIVR